MTDADRTQVLMHRLEGGDPRASAELLTLVYGELRRTAARLMEGERKGHTLEPTALVNEAYLRLMGHGPTFEGRDHFLRTAARAMRNVLVDHARSRQARRREGDYQRVPLDETLAYYEDRGLSLASVGEALERLSKVDPQLEQLVELRYFAGLENREAAAVLGVSLRSVERGWQTARAFLQVELFEAD